MSLVFVTHKVLERNVQAALSAIACLARGAQRRQRDPRGGRVAWPTGGSSKRTVAFMPVGRDDGDRHPARGGDASHSGLPVCPGLSASTPRCT